PVLFQPVLPTPIWHDTARGSWRQGLSYEPILSGDGDCGARHRFPGQQFAAGRRPRVDNAGHAAAAAAGPPSGAPPAQARHRPHRRGQPRQSRAAGHALLAARRDRPARRRREGAMSSKMIALKVLDALFLSAAIAVLLVIVGFPMDWLLAAA